MQKSQYKSLAFTTIIATGLCLSPTVRAEEGTADSGDKTVVGFGIHFGANFSDFSVDADSGSDLADAVKSNHTGYVLGAHAEFGLSEQFVIRPEINYSAKGYDFAGIANVRQSYLEIPVLAKFNILAGSIRPFLEIGPQFSFHVGSNVTTLGMNFTNRAESWDISGVAGGGVGFTISEDITLTGELRYLFGLKDLDSGADVSIRSGGFQTLVGLTFTN